MKAVKGNKEYTINEKQKAFYTDEGYDIIGEDGAVIAYGKGKMVPFETYISAVKRIEELEKINTELRTEIEATWQDGDNAHGEVDQKEPETPADPETPKKGKAAVKKAGE